MEVLLHKVCGRPASRTMTLRAAGPEDARRLLRLAERGAGRDAPPGAVRTRHAGKHRPLPERGPVHRRVGRRAAGSLLHPAVLRAGRAQLRRLYGHPARRSGTAGPTPTAPSSTPATGATVLQRKLTGSGAWPAPPGHRGHRGHRQPGESVQPQQRLGQRL